MLTERSMNRICFGILLAIVYLSAVCSAQQTPTANSSNAEQQRSPAPPPGPILGGDGTPNFIPIWRTNSYLLNSAIYQTSSGNVGVGTTTPVATLDVYGSVNAVAYDLNGARIISAPDGNLFIGLGAGASGTGSVGNTFVGNDAGSDTVGQDILAMKQA
jgi:hypothetical protein